MSQIRIYGADDNNVTIASTKAANSQTEITYCVDGKDSKIVSQQN